jgi:hypothetical protein
MDIVVVETNTHQQRVESKYALIYRTMVCADDCILNTSIVLVINVTHNSLIKTRRTLIVIIVPTQISTIVHCTYLGKYNAYCIYPNKYYNHTWVL